jgi:site-specific DNA recombinase
MSREEPTMQNSTRETINVMAHKRATIYKRVSSDKQEQDGSSLETQEAACLAYCREHGYTVAPEHIYQDVYTGMEYRPRPGLNKLLQAAARHEFDVVVFNSLERLSRKLSHQIVLTELLADNEIAIESVTEQIDDDSPFGQMFRSILSAAGEIEYARLRERIARGKMNRVAEKKHLLGTGPSLYGYKWNENRTAYLINDDLLITDAKGEKWSEAQVVLRIFDMAVQGMPLRKIAFTLASEGIFNRSGTIWGPNTIREMLVNEKYIGVAKQYIERVIKKPNGQGKSYEKRPDTEQIILPDGVIPPLVEVETFKKVQQQLEHNKQNAARNNKHPEEALLRCGLIKCGICEQNMFVSREQKQERIRYMCRTTNSLDIKIHFLPKLERHHLSIVGHIADAAAWKRAVEIIRNPEEVKQHVEARRAQLEENPVTKQLTAIENSIAKLTQTIKNLDRQITRLSEQTPDDDDQAREIDAAIDSLNQSKARHRREINDLEKDRSKLLSENEYWLAMEIAIEKFELWCNEWREKLDSASFADKRVVCEFLSIRVIVYKGDHEPPYEVRSEPLKNCVPDHLWSLTSPLSKYQGARCP